MIDTTLMAAILDSLKDPVLFADTDHVTRYMNKAASWPPCTRGKMSASSPTMKSIASLCASCVMPRAGCWAIMSAMHRRPDEVRLGDYSHSQRDGRKPGGQNASHSQYGDGAE